jgi:hypothetical protein
MARSLPGSVRPRCEWKTGVKDPPFSRAAIGLRTHSGWAVLVAVSQSAGSIDVLDRRRIELADSAVPGFPQPYHAAETLDIAEADKLVRGCIEGSRRMAGLALTKAIKDLLQRRFKVTACGLVAGSGRPLPSLDRILASHALIHTTEGEMFREAVRFGAKRRGLGFKTIQDRDAYVQAAGALHISTADIQGRIVELGQKLGPPWREDQKLATLAAWVALSQV